MPGNETKFRFDSQAEIGVSEEGKFVTTVDRQQIPAEISEYGPSVGAMVIYDDNGKPVRAIFSEAIG